MGHYSWTFPYCAFLVVVDQKGMSIKNYSHLYKNERERINMIVGNMRYCLSYVLVVGATQTLALSRYFRERNSIPNDPWMSTSGQK